jgi:hypothetical protein
MDDCGKMLTANFASVPVAAVLSASAPASVDAGVFACAVDFWLSTSVEIPVTLSFEDKLCQF